MKNYEILKIKNENIIIATSYVNPIDELESIANDLKEKRYVGEVIFDLLLCNGFNSNRFLKLFFDGEKLDIFSAKKIEVINEETRREIESYIVNQGYVNQGILQDSQIFILKH